MTKKDSGIEWIGEIPENWTTPSVKFVFYQSKSKSFEENPVVLSLARSGVKVRDISTNEGQLAESYLGYNIVQPNDVLLNVMDLISGANCSMSEISGVISPAYANLRLIDPSNTAKYFDYYFKLQYWSKAFFAQGKGVSFDNRWTLNSDALMNYPLVLPSKDEQKQIVAQIEKKCSRAVSLIDNLNSQIDKLKEYKKALITKCVTKGLDPNVPLKDSGIEWIGEIPENWTLTKLKRHSDIIMGQSPASEDIKEEGTTLFMQGNKDFGQKNPFPSLYCEICNKFSRVGDILLSVRAPVGAINESDKVYGIGRGLCSIKAIQIDRHYLKYYLFKSADDFKYYSNGTTFDEITVDILRNLYLVLPSASEQKYIASYLDKKCSEIDALILSKQQQIDKLNEYQKSLIYDYVTGKKEVI